MKKLKSEYPQTMKRGDKIYLDENKKEESIVNDYLSCRDGIVEMYEYNDSEGYGSLNRMFVCQNTKHESYCVVNQIYIQDKKYWSEDYMNFGFSDFKLFKNLLSGDDEVLIYGKYKLLRDYAR